MKYTSSGHSAFISCSSVILVPFILFVGFKEKLKKVDILSLVITLIGLFLLTYDLETKINIGDLITLVAMVAFAVNLVCQSKFVQNIEIIPFLLFQFISATIVSAIGLLFIHSDQIFEISLKSFLSISYLALFATLFCFSAITWVLKYLNPFYVALLISAEPIIAILLSYLFIGEKTSFKEIVGMTVVMLGILYYQISQNKTSVQKERVECCKCS